MVAPQTQHNTTPNARTQYGIVPRDFFSTESWYTLYVLTECVLTGMSRKFAVNGAHKLVRGAHSV